MELLAYILIMLAMGAIGGLCSHFDSWGETPLGVLGMLANVIFAIMAVLLVVFAICAITGVEAGA